MNREEFIDIFAMRFIDITAKISFDEAAKRAQECAGAFYDDLLSFGFLPPCKGRITKVMDLGVVGPYCQITLMTPSKYLLDEKPYRIRLTVDPAPEENKS